MDRKNWYKIAVEHDDEWKEGCTVILKNSKYTDLNHEDMTEALKIRLSLPTLFKKNRIKCKKVCNKK
ncbi:hypothetical protein [Anaerolentibacter hominis]|uniref:hypothetical protein n=1 Tax=Anaerolentibacter hominis TaxID=3079009 RepID=UPI0031B7EEC9